MKNKIIKDLKKLSKNLKITANANLKKYNTFGVERYAKLLIEPKDFEEIIKVVNYLEKNKICYDVFGNGSNILFLKSENKTLVRICNDDNNIYVFDNIIRVSACTPLNNVVNTAINNKLRGLEDAIGIPATIGGAIAMNASCFNFEMSKIVKKVVAFDKGVIKVFNKDECKFSYRKSIFQNKNLLIVNAELELQKDENFDYVNRVKFVAETRAKTQPYNVKTAGSVFKNFDNIKVAKLLDDEGLKGLQIGGARVSEKHANFIVCDNGTAEDIYNLILKIKKLIYKKYGLKLETEIKII